MAISKTFLDLLQQAANSGDLDLMPTGSILDMIGTTTRSDTVKLPIVPKPPVESYTDPLFPNLSVLVHEKVVSHGPDYPADASGTAVRVWKVTVNGEELQKPFYDRAIVSMAAKRLFHKIRDRFLEDMGDDFGAF